MKRRRNMILFSLAAGVLVSCIWHPSKSSFGDRTEAAPAVDKCKIDIAVQPPCTLSKGADERIVWINNSNDPMLVCMDPSNDPFDAFAWLVPANGQRKSGPILPNVNLPSGQTLDYEYWPSKTSCAQDFRKKDNPKIKIGN
jgi:hypothetical protein